jgi:hypothetical protein
MSDHALVYRIIRRDGTPFRDEHGVAFTFESRIAAERWMMPGERVEPVRKS